MKFYEKKIFYCFSTSTRAHHPIVGAFSSRRTTLVDNPLPPPPPPSSDTFHKKLRYCSLLSVMAKPNATTAGAKATPSPKSSRRDKSNLTNERKRAKQKIASIRVATGVSEAASEVRRSKKSKQTNEELNSGIQQQNANEKIKCINSDNLNTHCTTNTSKPSAATPSPQIAVPKSHDALNVKRQLKFKGKSLSNLYLKNNCNVSPLLPLIKMMTFTASPSVSMSSTKVSPLNSPEKTIRVQRNNSVMKSEIELESVCDKLNLYEIDWTNKNITTAEAKKYPQFARIKSTQEAILFFLANQFKPSDIRNAFAALIAKHRGCTHHSFYPLPSQKVKLINSFLELVHDENSIIVNAFNQNGR